MNHSMKKSVVRHIRKFRKKKTFYRLSKKAMTSVEGKNSEREKGTDLLLLLPKTGLILCDVKQHRYFATEKIKILNDE